MAVMSRRPVSRSTLRSHLAPGALVAAGLLVAPACGEIPEPAGFVAPTSTTTGGLFESTDEAAATEAQALDVDDQSGFVPRAPRGYVPEVVLVADGQVMLVPADGTAEPASGFPGADGVVEAADDLLGGLVVQRATTERQIVWLQQGAEPITVESGAVDLLDVGFDGSPVAVVLTGGELVERIRLADNERTVMITLRQEDRERLLSLSASGAVHAVAIANNRCGVLRFYGSDGEEVPDLQGPGEPDCIVPRRPAYGAVALSPGGRTLAYTVVTYRADGIPLSTELRLRNLNTGADYATRNVAELGEEIDALAFDGQRVVFSRVVVDGETEVYLLDMADEAPATRIDPGAGTQVESVSFAQVPLAGER